MYINLEYSNLNTFAEEMYETRKTMNVSESGKMAKMSKSKVDSDEKGGAAVIPICLPLCCAAPCVIM